MKRILPLIAAALALPAARAANPFLPLWEFIPDGEPHVFEDPDNPGRERVYVYGSHDTLAGTYCGRDQVVWSAPVEDLRRWRFDGVAFSVAEDADGRPLRKSRIGDTLFAPDVAETRDADGRKTYWLYPNDTADGRKTMVARSDRPDGPFKVANWSAGDPAKTEGVMGFDPAVLVDDDGRVYGYWGWERSFAAELDPATMATVKPGTEIVSDMVGGRRQPGVFRFFEASSIRKIKGKYVFVYSRWTENGEFGLPDNNYTLAYAYSDGPLGPWTYGGTLVDGRGRETGPDGRTVATAHPSGNTHGSLCEIGGRWYVFYHRQTGTDEFSRQAMVAPVEVEVEDGPGGAVRISEAEFTSEGFETDGLDPFERHAAGIACHYTGPRPAEYSAAPVSRCSFSGPYPRPVRLDGYGVRDPYSPRVSRCPMTHVTDGSVIGYKYFNFDGTHGRDGLELVLETSSPGVDGKVEIWVGRPSAAAGGTKVGELALSASRGDGPRSDAADVRALSAVKGRKALYLVFSAERKDRSICDLDWISFRVAPGK